MGVTAYNTKSHEMKAQNKTPPGFFCDLDRGLVTDGHDCLRCVRRSGDGARFPGKYVYTLQGTMAASLTLLLELYVRCVVGLHPVQELLATR